jgi:hypothetical protein
MVVGRSDSAPHCRNRSVIAWAASAGAEERDHPDPHRLSFEKDI